MSDGRWPRRLVSVGAAAASALACASVKGRSPPAHLVDLSHTLTPRFPFIPVQDKTFAFRISPIATLAENGVNANKWELTEHNGTHLDARYSSPRMALE